MSASQSARYPTEIRILLGLVSFFVPLAGFIAFAILYTKDDGESREVGKLCLYLAIASLALGLLCFCLYFFFVFGLSFLGIFFAALGAP